VGVYLMGVHLMGVCLMGVHLMGMCLMGLYLIPCTADTEGFAYRQD